jgi:hypothetical protein
MYCEAVSELAEQIEGQPNISASSEELIPAGTVHCVAAAAQTRTAADWRIRLLSEKVVSF